MSYEAYLSKEGLEQNYLAVLTLRRIVEESWELVTGDIYKVAFDYGEVSSVTTVLPETGSITTFEMVASYDQMTIFKSFYDRDAGEIYFKGYNPGNGLNGVVIVYYDLFLSTKPVNWHSRPTDTTSAQVHYEGLISRAPTLTHSQADSVFGFVPISVSSIECLGVDSFWSRHLYDSSFHLCKIRLYHWIDRLKLSNLQYFITGFTKSFTITDTEISIEITEPQEYLNREIFAQYYPLHSVDQAHESRPLRRFFGMVDGVPLVNYTFNTGKITISATDNHIWAFGDMSSQYYLDQGTAQTNTIATTHTTTRTYVANTNGFAVGDDIFMVGSGTRYATITAIGANYFDHIAAASAFPTGLIGTVYRYTVSSVAIVQNGKRYYPKANRDYVVDIAATTPRPGIVSFVNGFEAVLGMQTLSSNDTVVARVYGQNRFPTMNGADFGSLDPKTLTLNNGVVLIYQLLKEAGIPESEIDLETFTILAGEVTTPVGFAIPRDTQQTMSTYRDALVPILTSLMLQLFVDHDGKWTIRQLGPLKIEPDHTFTELDIERSGFRYRVSYDDLVSQANIKYGYKELNPDIANSVRESWSIISVTNQTMAALHGIKSEQDFETVLTVESDAETLAGRIAYLLSDRRGVLTIEGGNIMRSTELNDTILISRALMPGEEYTGEPISRKFAVIETSKGLNSVSLTLEDLKGIQDNEGDW